MIIQKLKEDIKTATKNRDHLRSDILKLILAECQTRNDESDNFVINYIKKVMANNDETMKYKGGDQKLAQENGILYAYLPPKVSSTELSNLINSMLINGTIKREKKSIGAVTKVCKDLGFDVDSQEVIKFLMQPQG